MKEYEPYPMERVTTPEGRRYKIPDTDECYESITTALGKNPEKKKSLMEWRKRVGEEEADRISRIASHRGTRVHAVIEKYLEGDKYYDRGEMPNVIEMFNSIKSYLDTNIASVYMQEAFLFSHKYKLAGQVDCIANCDGYRCVIDFKTSSKPKKKEWIEDYFLQCAAYSFMFEEMYGDKIHYNIVLIAVENDKPQFFLENPYDYENHEFFTKRLLVS
jgi:genome maintenance exonuclease 1